MATKTEAIILRVVEGRAIVRMEDTTDMSKKRVRTTLYAAFHGAGAGEPVVNVYDWDRGRLQVHMEDRKANGIAFADERIIKITIAVYNRLLIARGLPIIRDAASCRSPRRALGVR